MTISAHAVLCHVSLCWLIQIRSSLSCLARIERFPRMKNYSFWATHYQNCVAPVVTTLLCLPAISLKNVICSFVNLFPCCWNKSEWLHRPGQASVSVAFRAAGITKCLFSLRSEEEGLTANCLDVALSIKPESLGLPHHVHLSTQNDWLRSRESKGDFRVSLGSHQVDLGHSCVRLETLQGGRAVKKHMYPSFIKSNCCFSKLANEPSAPWIFY